ncbi:hypothetical protein WA538_003434, partial [Blastocystis sp. DL]
MTRCRLRIQRRLWSIRTTLRKIRSVMGGLVFIIYTDKYIFVAVKVALVCLAYLSFHMFFNLFIRPLFISLEERIGMVIAALQDQWCHPEGCTPEDEETIQAIIKNIKESGRR